MSCQALRLHSHRRAGILPFPRPNTYPPHRQSSPPTHAYPSAHPPACLPLPQTPFTVHLLSFPQNRINVCLAVGRTALNNKFSSRAVAHLGRWWVGECVTGAAANLRSVATCCSGRTLRAARAQCCHSLPKCPRRHLYWDKLPGAFSSAHGCRNTCAGLKASCACRSRIPTGGWRSTVGYRLPNRTLGAI